MYHVFLKRAGSSLPRLRRGSATHIRASKLTPEQVSASNEAITKSSLHQVDKSFLFCKPYGCLSSFTRNNDSTDDIDAEDGPQSAQRTLRDVFVDAPTNIYPAGRLDYRSEGLLILTSNNFFKNALADPKNHLPKNYWVLVQGKPSEKQLKSLQSGMRLNNGDEILPCEVNLLPEEPELIKTHFKVPAPIQVRVRSDNLSEYTWMNFTLEQGLNRQIRRMCAAVSLPALRIVRHSVGPFSLGSFNLTEGQHREISASDFDMFWKYYYERKAESRKQKSPRNGRL